MGAFENVDLDGEKKRRKTPACCEEFFPERLGEGRFLGAVSLSSMT